MAYKQEHQYGYRDSLEKGDPEKVIKGEYFDDEFSAIEEAINKLDPNADGGVDIGEIDGLQELLDDKADKDHTHDEYLTEAPNDGKQYVRESEAWAEIVIPDDAGIEEPSSDGTPYARQVEGGQSQGAWVEAATPEDIEYLDGRIDAIEGNISGGGGFVEAPNDGNDYARNGLAPAWVKTYNADYIDDIETAYKNADAVLEGQINALEPYDDTQIKADLAAEEQARIDGDTALQDQIDGLPDQDFSWDSITGKPTDYPPSSHDHSTDEITGLDTELEGIKDDVADLEGAVGTLTGQLAMGGSYSASTGLVVTPNLSGFTAGQPLPDPATVLNTFVIVSESGSTPEELSEGDWLVAGSSGWVPIKYGTSGVVDWGNITNKPTEFPPEAHNQSWSTITDKPADYPPSSHDHAWDEITGKPTEFPPESHNHVVAEITDFDPADYQPVGDYATTKYVDDSIAAIDIPDSNIADGTQDGIVATWDSTANSGAGKWTPDSSLTIDASGDATFSGTVSSNNLETNRPTNGFFFKANYGDTGLFSSFNHSAGSQLEIFPLGGQMTVTGDATFTGTVTATAFVGDGSGLTGVGGGYDGSDAVKLTGNQTIAGAKTFSSNVTAPDFVATSDERVKDNITTAPVGLIDSLKGREWDWKESGEKGSGVVAQELEEVLPHLVHTDDDGMKSVAYNGLVAYLIEEVKALKAEVEALKDG